MVLVSGRILWRRCCVLFGSSGNEKQSMKRVTLWCPVHNTVSLRWGELLMNADNALPVSIVLDPGVRVVMRQLRGRSGPAKTRDSERGGERRKITFVKPTRRYSLLLMYTSTCARAAWIHRRAMKGSDSMRHRCMGLWNTLQISSLFKIFCPDLEYSYLYFKRCNRSEVSHAMCSGKYQCFDIISWDPLRIPSTFPSHSLALELNKWLKHLKLPGTRAPCHLKQMFAAQSKVGFKSNGLDNLRET